MSIQHEVSRWLGKLMPPKRRTVKRSSQSYLEEQRWSLTGSGPAARWDGWYRTRYGSFRGKIECSTPPKFYVKDPPEGISRHRHRSCFTDLNSGGWWSVHFAIKPRDVDSGAMEIERMLHEAFRLSQKVG